MCGIAGVRRFDSEPVSRELLANMAARLVHRGPDDTGIWTQGDVGFAHTRLSIIDVLGSQQPMAGAGGDTHLVFNGEILNYRELRGKRLVDKPGRTRCYRVPPLAARTMARRGVFASKTAWPCSSCCGFLALR